MTLSLERATGRIAWRREAPRPRILKVDKRNHPASPSPATDGDNVFVFFQDFGVLAYDRDGNERWRVPLGPFDNAYGMGASPVVAGDSVVMVCDQSNGCVHDRARPDHRTPSLEDRSARSAYRTLDADRLHAGRRPPATARAGLLLP